MTKWKGVAASYAPNVAQLVSTPARRAFTLALLASLAAGPAGAADLYWDANGGLSPSLGGAGAWSTSGLNWSANNDGISGPFNPWNSAAGDNAIFEGTAGTVTLGTPITVGSLTFNVNGYTIAGTAANPLTLGGPTPTITANGNATISAVIAGSAGLTKNGAGTLVLSGTNTYTGATTVSAGVLRAGSTQAFGTGAMTVNTGATLDLAGNANTVRGLNGAGSVTLGAATLTTNGNASFSGTISGTGGVTVAAGTQTFSGCTNSYVGATTITGTLSVSCLRNGLQPSDIGASSKDSANLNLAGGTLLYTGGNVTTDRGFTLTGTGTINVSNAATTLEFAGVVTGTSLNKTGSGTLVLSGTNSYGAGGATLVNGGTVRAGSTSAFGVSGLRMDTTGATLELDDFDNTVAYINQADLGVTGGSITLGSATLTLTGAANTNYNGAISGTGGLVKNGNGRQILSAGASSYTGSTTINGGILAVASLANGNSNSSIGASASEASNLIINGGTLQYIGGGDSTDRKFTLGNNGGSLDASGTGAIDFTSTAPVTLTDAGNRTLTLTGNSTADNTLSARIDDPSTGTTALTKTGTGTWILANAESTYTGKTTISGGVLAVHKLADGGEASSIGMSSNDATNLVIGSGSTLRYTGAGDTTNRLFTLETGTTLIESSGIGAIVFSNTGSAAYTGTGNRTLALGGTNTGLNTMGGTIIDGPGGATTLAKNGTGTWVLTGDNSYSGNTVVNNGNLIIGNGGGTGNAGTGIVIVNSATSTLSFNRNDTFNFDGTLSGPGTIAQVGTGTTVLTSTTNAIGATTISAGTLQVNGGLVTPTIAMSGTSALMVNGTVTGNGLPTTITGDGLANNITINTGGALTATGDLAGGSNLVTLAGTMNTGAGTLGLGGGNDTLTLNDGGTIVGDVTGGAGTDTLLVNNTANRTLTAASVPGFEVLDKQGSGILRLTGAHGFSAGVTVHTGTLVIGDGTTAGSVAGDILNNANLTFHSPGVRIYAGTISGTGWINKNGSGTQILTGDNTYAGTTFVNSGTLLINGDQSGAHGPTSVGLPGTLGGNGTVGGDVTVLGTISPGDAGNSPNTLTINGNLTLFGPARLNYDFGQAGVAGGAFNDLIDVGGNLTLDGTLNVTQTPGGTFGPGVYRIFNYGGDLTDNGLNVADPDYFVQTSVDKQVNLVNSAGLALSYWDGDAGPHSNGIVNGGDGTWQAAGGQNWTDATGLFAAPFDNASFAIFQGAAGTVDVDSTTNGQVQAVGMQFATDGYVVQGEGIVLVDDSTQAGLQSIIRVGDGTAAGSGYVATISSDLSGSTQLVKADLGTLVLSGTNSYTAGTAINGGAIEVSADTNLGAAAGPLSLDGGTLHNTAAFASGRAVTLGVGGGTFETDADLALNGVIGGAGTLTKVGGATLVLAGTNTYQGGTVINGGTIEVSANTNLGNASGTLAFNGGSLHSTGTFTAARNVTLNAGGGTFDTDSGTTLTLANAVTGAGDLAKGGAGTLVLAATNTYGGGTTISAGTLQLGDGGTTGSITGDVLNDGILAFNRSNSYTFAGLISGSGAVEQIGGGTTILTADNSYTDETFVREGTLIVNGDQTAASGMTTVEDGGVLGGIGTIGGNVAVLDGGALNPGNPGTTPGTLTINGSLALDPNAALNYNFGQAGVVGGAYNDLTIVQGDLTLDGTINVAETPGGNFGPGIYRVISYGGTLTNLGLSESSPDHVVQTSIDGQVNLVDISSMTLNFWDGDAGPKDNDLVEGGSGTWRAAGDDNWTDDAGSINAAFSNGSFAIFGGSTGTVDVDNDNGQVAVTGMQFATGGYLVQGDAITLDGTQATIRVGDGTAPGAGYVATIASVLQGDAQLVKRDLGTLVLTGTNTYTGGTLIQEGTLQFTSDANLGDAAGGITLDGGTLQNTLAETTARGITLSAAGGTLLTDADLTLSGIVGGPGGLTKVGSANLTLTGANTYAGPTTVSAGGLYVEGDQNAVTGLVSVAGGATIGGGGTIGGSVTVADGGVLNPGAADSTPGMLTIAGNLTLLGGSILNYSLGAANVAGGALNDLVTVGGNLTLDGTLNVTETAGGSFGPGIYRLFNYAGTLTNNGLTLGTIPAAGSFVQTAIANQVNLVNTSGLTLNYWDGAAGPKFDGTIQGGDGVWQNSTGNDDWTDSAGAVNAAFTDGSFAIFSGSAGTVTVDDSLGQVVVSGAQFAVTGYEIQGDTIGLDGPVATIRVGDGTSAGSEMVTTISAGLSGSSQLVKTDLGTLVLTGVNSYTGGTIINAGTLQVSADANLGDAAGDVTFNGGTLNTTASFSSDRAINLIGAGTITADAGTKLTLSGLLSGSGAFTKSSAGTLTFAGDGSTFTGTTSIAGGVFSVSGNLCGDIDVLSGGRLQGTGTVCDTTNHAGGVVAPGDSIGTLTVW